MLAAATKRFLGRGILPLALCFCLSACTSLTPEPKWQAPIPAVDSSLFTKRPADIPTVEQIFYLSPQQKSRFLNKIDSLTEQHKRRHERIADYVKDLVKDFTYTNETLSASEALATQSGDCTTLATLTTALALAGDIDVGYREINSSPVFDERGSLAIRSLHVRTLLYEPKDFEEAGHYVSFRRTIKIDFFPPEGGVQGRSITARQFIGMYYRNLAADALLNDDYNRAFWMLMEALTVSPYDQDSINMLAIVHRRSGHIEKAEELYLYGIDHAISQVTLLRNYRILLRLQGRFEEAEDITLRLATLDDPNPFHWIDLAEEHYVNNDYDSALYYFDKAIKTAPNLHHPYMGKAKTWYQMGEIRRARKALEKAVDNASDDVIRSRYQLKLKSLQTTS